jgi:hypothetical protein
MHGRDVAHVHIADHAAAAGQDRALHADDAAVIPRDVHGVRIAGADMRDALRHVGIERFGSA